MAVLARRSIPAETAPAPTPLRPFRLDPPVPPRIVAAAYRSERYLSKAARALIRVMTDVAASRFQNG